jgi:hypothetical protein
MGEGQTCQFFFRREGLPTTEIVAELRALAYSASVAAVPLKPTADEDKATRYLYVYHVGRSRVDYTAPHMNS